MKRTILFLMNGFGIEKASSYNIYNDKLMPNLDKYTKDYMFAPIETPAYNYLEGYRLFSTGSNVPLTYALIKNYMEKFDTNPNMNFFLNNITGNIQLYLFLENDKSLEHLRNLLKFIRTKYTNSIFLHIVLTSPDTENYKEIEKILSKITYDFTDCKIATIIGLNSLKGDLTQYMNMLTKQVGERWVELEKKFVALTNTKTAPNDVKEFYMKEGFKIQPDDTYLFFNYDNIDINNLLANLTKINSIDKMYSMFPIKGIKYPMFAFPVSSTSLVNSLNSIEAKALIFTEANYMGYINYYCNGLSSANSENLNFSKIDDSLLLDKNKLDYIIKNTTQELLIFDYHVENCTTADELKDKLSKIDNMLLNLHDVATTNEISLIISSLYGIKKEIAIDMHTKAIVDFSLKVPFIVIDPVFKKNNFRVGLGNIYNLSSTVLTNVNNKYNGAEVLIKKKSALYKMFKK